MPAEFFDAHCLLNNTKLSVYDSKASAFNRRYANLRFLIINQHVSI